jgi:3-ketoacyl-CoA synthase
VLRTNLASNDAAFNCVYETEDEEGHRGVRLSKDLMAIAGQWGGRVVHDYCTCQGQGG